MSISSDARAFIKELEAFCIKRGFEIAGTCNGEGVYASITVKAVGQPSAWQDWDNNKFGFTVEGE